MTPAGRGNRTAYPTINMSPTNDDRPAATDIRGGRFSSRTHPDTPASCRNLSYKQTIQLTAKSST